MEFLQIITGNGFTLERSYKTTMEDYLGQLAIGVLHGNALSVILKTILLENPAETADIDLKTHEDKVYTSYRFFFPSLLLWA